MSAWLRSIIRAVLCVHRPGVLSTQAAVITRSPGETWATRKELYNTTVLENGALLKDQWDNSKFVSFQKTADVLTTQHTLSLISQDFWFRMLSRYPFRIFKSHFMPEGDSGPDVLPVKSRPKVKFLAMSRNFLDAVASLIPFFDSHSEEFRQMWGGFPPTSSADKAASVEERLTEVLPGGMLSPLYFGYVNGWWPLRNEPNVLLLHYADAKRDRAGTVAKIAAFMNVDLTKEQLNKIVHLTSIEEMRKLTDHFSYCLPLNQDFHGKVMKSGSMTRKGAVGEGKVVFSAEQQARAKAAEEAQFTDPALLNWARNGGGFD